MEQKADSVSPRSNERRNAYVIEQLTGAMLALLEEKPIADISVSELCGRAGVGRTSFYRNYGEKEDILRAQLRRLSRCWMDEYGQHPDRSVRALVQMVFSHFEEHREFYGLLNRRGLIYLLKDIMLELCDFDPERELPAAYASAYVGFFLYGWIEVWFRRGMRDRTEDLLAHLPQT